MKRGAVYLVSQIVPAPREPGDDERRVGAERPVLRPVVLVTRDAINRHSPIVLVCPLVDAASVQRLYPSDVQIHAPEGGLTTDSVVLTGQLRALARTQLVRHLGDVSLELLRQIDQALRITLDLE